MHALAVLLIALAGALYCLAAWQRWRSLAGPRTDADDASQHQAPLLWLGFALHSASLVAALIDRSARDFCYVVLGVWAGIAALLFASRFIAGPSRGLLVLPIGCAALLVAMASVAGHPQRGGGHGAIGLVHAGFMSGYLAALLVAGSSGILYLIASRQLKSASTRAFRLPALPEIGRLTERSVVVSTAMLMAGVATGGAAMEQAGAIHLAQPAIAIALINLAVLVLVLGARAAHRLGQRGQARAATLCLALGGVELVAILVAPHVPAVIHG
jgi:hypothetical protein